MPEKRQLKRIGLRIFCCREIIFINGTPENIPQHAEVPPDIEARLIVACVSPAPAY
jgi:hypothetical protein